MTAQMSNTIINECTEADFSDLHLYAVLTGDIVSKENTAPYSFLQKANKEKVNVFSACWNGYTSKYKINESKELVLIGFQYPALLPERIEPDDVYEVAVGDFWLDMRPSFFEGFVYVPFKNGKLITNKNEWIFHGRMSKGESAIISNMKRFLSFLFQLGKRS